MATPELSDRVRADWQRLVLFRHSAQLPRYLACAVLALFFCLGLRAAFFAPAADEAPAPAPAQADAPSRAFALQFARAYLSYDARRPSARARALGPLVGESVAPGAGFSAAGGTQRVEWVEIASDQRALAGGRVVTVAAGVSTQRLPVYLAVTVRHRRGRGVELLGYPSLVGAPAIASATPPAREAVTDPALLEVAERVLRNYLAGALADLRADLTPAAEVTLPTRRLRLDELESLLWLGGPGSGAVLATLSASDHGGATYTLSYELGIAHRERPYVEFIEVIPSQG
jgi:hypothetical protein